MQKKITHFLPKKSLTHTRHLWHVVFDVGNTSLLKFSPIRSQKLAGSLTHKTVVTDSVSWDFQLLKMLNHTGHIEYYDIYKMFDECNGVKSVSTVFSWASSDFQLWEILHHSGYIEYIVTHLSLMRGLCRVERDQLWLSWCQTGGQLSWAPSQETGHLISLSTTPHPPPLPPLSSPPSLTDPTFLMPLWQSHSLAVSLLSRRRQYISTSSAATFPLVGPLHFHYTSTTFPLHFHYISTSGATTFPPVVSLLPTSLLLSDSLSDTGDDLNHQILVQWKLIIAGNNGVQKES